MTKGDIAFRLVLTSNVAGAVDTVWLVREWLLNIATVVTIKSSILQTLGRCILTNIISMVPYH